LTKGNDSGAVERLSKQHSLHLRVLCGPLRLCAEYWVLLLQYPILSAKTQRTAKHAEGYAGVA